MSASYIAFFFSIASGMTLFIAMVANEARGGAPTAAVAAEKYPTDDATRAGMQSIRARVIDVHTLITHRRLPLAAARQFGAALQMETDRIVRARAETLPTPDPIQPLLKKIADGGRMVAGHTEGHDAIDGLVEIVDALESYARTFEHPGWRSLQEQ